MRKSLDRRTGHLRCRWLKAVSSIFQDVDFDVTLLRATLKAGMTEWRNGGITESRNGGK